MSGFSIHLEDKYGFRSKDDAVYRLEVLPDKAPVVRITYPERKEELITQKATILIGFEALDDFAVKQLFLRYTVDGGEEKGIELTLDAPARSLRARGLTRGDRVGVIVPYATFGTDLDLDRYAWLARRYDVGVVVDAAASLGTIDAAGRGFGTGAPFAIVYSMHATKTFAVAEGGLIHCGDADRIATLRAMANFGFDPSGSSGARSATLPGINAKLPEVIALMARAKLTEIELRSMKIAHKTREALQIPNISLAN